jgi:hypothetical protein
MSTIEAERPTQKRTVATPRPPRDGAPLLTAAEVAFLLGCAIQTLSLWRLEGRGPRWCRIGRMVRYKREDVERFANRPTVSSTFEADALDRSPAA